MATDIKNSRLNEYKEYGVLCHTLIEEFCDTYTILTRCTKDEVLLNLGKAPDLSIELLLGVLRSVLEIDQEKDFERAKNIGDLQEFLNSASSVLEVVNEKYILVLKNSIIRSLNKSGKDFSVIKKDRELIYFLCAMQFKKMLGGINI